MIVAVQFLQLTFDQPQTQNVMKYIATLLFSLALFSVAANADDKPVGFQQLPSSAKTFIKSEFPLESISFITKD